MEFGKIRYLSLEELRQALTEIPYSNPLILISETGALRWQLNASITAVIAKKGGGWFSQLDKNPTQYTLSSALSAIAQQAIDGIVAIGGGSAIDLAKQISAYHSAQMAHSPQALLTAINQKDHLVYSKDALPITAVPTTAGTGSEVTQWATLWDRDSGKKHSLDAPWLLPESVWIVPELTLSLPPLITLATGMDALCHAAEAYWAVSTNPMAQSIALQAASLIVNNLAAALTQPENLSLRKALCTGSLLAGIAFSQTRTTACHSISYPLTAHYGVAHGFAVAVSLSAVAEVNRTLIDLTPLDALFSPFGGIQKWIDDTCAHHIKLRLSTFHISETDLDFIAAQAFTGGRMDNNPVPFTQESIQSLLHKIL